MTYLARPIVLLLNLGFLVAALAVLPSGTPASAAPPPARSVALVSVVNTPTVNLASSPETPVFVREVGDPPGEPFHSRLENAAMLDAPPNSRMVVEYLTGFCNIPTGESLTTLELLSTLGEPGVLNPFVQFFIIPTQTGQSAPGFDHYVFVHQTRIYTNQLTLFATKSSAGLAICRASISGRIVAVS